MIESISNAYHSFINYIGMSMANMLGMPVQASKLGDKVDILNGWVHWLMLLLFIGWGVFIIYVLIKYNRNSNPKADYDGIKGKFSKYLEVGIIAFEAFLLVALAIPGWAELKVDVPKDNDETLTIRVIGEQFKWYIHYPGEDGVFGKTFYDVAIEGEEFTDDHVKSIGISTEYECVDKKYHHDEDACLDNNSEWVCYGCDDVVTNSDLKLPKDKLVKILLSTKDVIHGFWIPEMRVKQDAVPGIEVPLYFTPTMSSEDFINKIIQDHLANGEEYRFGEVFVDANNNGKFDEGEEFTDLGNGKWDKGEEYTDTNDNGRFDEDEEYVDLGDKRWNPPKGYEIACAQLCGSNHYMMRGNVEILEEKDFNDWYKEQSEYWLEINEYERW